jgi:glycosyltransferase involved in cell wall biosynthesis
VSASPVVSVVTPTKNRRALLIETIESVRRQTFGSWEHIIVDDGSDDGTAEEVGAHAEIEPRIRFIKRVGEKTGANVCRNMGVRESRSELIVFLDSDDLLRPHCLQRRAEVMQRNADLDFVVFPAGIFRNQIGDLQGVYHPQDPGDDLLRFVSLECPWQTSGAIWRRYFLEKIGGFDEALLSMQDLEMHVRALAARGKYVFFAEPDHDIRWQDEAFKTSVRHFNDPAFIEGSEKVREKLLNTVSTRGLLTWSRQRALVGLCFGAAESWLRSRRLRRAIWTWIRGCRLQHVSWQLQIMGALMLCLERFSLRQNGVCSRLVNKWKGWVRFRQEPALLERPNGASVEAGE